MLDENQRLNPWNEFHATQNEFLQLPPGLGRFAGLSFLFTDQYPRSAVSPRTVEQFLHAQAGKNPGDGRAHQRTAVAISRTLGSGWLPPELNTQDFMTNEQAVATLSEIRRGDMDTAGYGAIAHHLTRQQLSADPIIRDVVRTKHAPDNLHCDAPMARLLGRLQIIPDWVLNHFIQARNGSVFFGEATEAIAEERVPLLLGRLPEKERPRAAEHLFVDNGSRRATFSVKTLELLRQEAMKDKDAEFSVTGTTNGGVVGDDLNSAVLNVVREEEDIFVKVLSSSIYIPADVLRWLMNHLRVEHERVDWHTQIVLTRLIHDGMMDDWFAQEGLDGLPGDLRYDLLESQVGDWADVCALPFNDPKRLAGNGFGCDC